MKTKSNSISSLLLKKVTVVELNSKTLFEIKGGSQTGNTGGLKTGFSNICNVSN